jgi:hypothetical protein
MAAFDPDAYLAAPPEPPTAFDPDAYLAAKPATAFDPDAYLNVPTSKGPKVLPDTDTSSDFMRGIRNYPGQTESLLGSAQAVAGLAAKKLGFEDTGTSLIQKGLGKIQEGEGKTVSKKSDEFTEALEKGIGTVLTDWLPYQVGAGAANIAESLAFAGLGAGVGAVTGFGAGAVPGAAAGVLSKTLVKQGIKEAAEDVLKKETAKAIADGATKEAAKEAGKAAMQTFVEEQAKKVITTTAGKEAFAQGAEEFAKAGAKKAGSYAGTAAQAGVHGIGEVGGRAIQEGKERGENVEDIDLGRVLPAAVVHSVADFVNNRIGLGALKIGDTASKYLITDIAKRIAITGVKETGGEEIQSIAERYGAKLSLTDAEALKEYINTAAASFGMAVAPGAIGGARTHLAKQLELQPGGTQTETETEEQKKAKAGAPAITDQQLDDFLSGKASTIPTKVAPVKGSPEELAAKYLTAYPEGKEGDISTDRNAELNVTKLNGLLKKLGIEAPKAEKGKTRINAMAALRDYMGKKNADITEEEITDIPDLTGTTDGTQTTETEQTEAQGQQATTTAIKEFEEKSNALVAEMKRVRDANERLILEPGSPDFDAVFKKKMELHDAHDVLSNQLQALTVTPSTTPTKTAVTPSITPEIQNEINRRMDAIATLEDNGAADKTIQKAKDNLSKYKESVGLPGTVLSAKRPTEQNVFQYRDEARIADLQAQLANAQANNGSQRSIDRLQKEIKVEQEKPTNVTLQTNPDQYQTLLDERTQREKDQAAAQARNEPRYGQQNIPANTEELYNDTREQVNAKVEEDNAKRDELAKQHDALAKQLALLEEKRTALDEQGDEANKKKDEVLENQLLEQSSKVAKQEDAVRAQLQPIAQALNDYGSKQTLIPEWGRLDADEKDVYFNYIKKNTLEEHATAAEALRTYRKEQGSRSRGYGNKKMSPTERRVALAYEENRASYSKIFPLKFPRWGDLSDEAKRVYLRKVIKVTTDPITGKETLTYTGAGVLQDAAFADLGMHLLKEAGNMDAADKKKAEGNFKLIQQQIAVETKLYEERRAKNEADMQRFNQIMGRTPGVISGMTHSVLPSNVVRMVKDGDLKGVLQYLRTLGDVKTSNQEMTLGKKILKEVAQSIFSMNLKTAIRYVESLPGGDLAIYDPTKDVIFITADGLTNGVVLHEVVHAATVKVLNDYTMGRLQLLTPEQIRGVEHLISIMNATKGVLQEEHPRAYESIFEFVAYSLTDETLQADLHDMNLTGGLAIAQRLDDPTKQLVSILPDDKSAWSAFKLSIVKVLNAGKTLFTKSGKLIPGTKQSLLVEVSAAFDNILAVPTEPIYLDQLPAKGKQKTPKPATKPRTANDYKLKSEVVPKSFTQYVRTLATTQSGHLMLERIFSSKRAVLRKLSEQLARSNLLQYTGDKINDIYGQITTSVADAKNYFNAYVDEDLEALNSAVGKFARAAGIDTQTALETLHPYLEAIHETERRAVKFLLKVPLIAAADTQRQRIIDIIDTQVLNQAQAQRLRKMLDDIVYTTDPTTGQRVLSSNVEKLGNKYDINSEEYNVTGLTSAEAANYRNSPVIKAHQAEVDQIVAAMQRLGESTTELNKIGHYWSQPVSNRVAFYGWKHYIPLKGNPQHSEVDEMLDFDSRALGRELQDSSGAFGGRISVSKNPILQMSVDATRAAIRAGQRNLTLAIKNSLEKSKLNPNGQGLIIGQVVDTISFKDRTNEDLLRKYKGENHIFHYNDDGTIDILKVQDKALRESIRQTFKSSNPLIDKANQITGLIAQGHTRYNYNFGPMNFVRDALTNAFVMGADMGPAKAAQYIKAMASVVVNGGMYKSMQVARLYQSGHASDIARLKQMAQKDTFVKHMYELISQGGMVTHMSGLSLKSQFQDLHKQIGAKGVMYKKEQFDKFVDTWTNMFELASRTSAYMVAKDNYYAENKERGMTDAQAMAEASARAVSFSKNLANFEQVGEWGKAMGALYMFFRPSATGAARSLQAITPAFTSLQSAVDALPPSVRSNPVALEAYKKNYAIQKRNAKIMMGSLIALGFFAHTMSKMMAPDDDLGRNAVDADDMDRWTRYARFHIPNSLSEPMGLGKDVVFQMPWGMGLGAFCAAGAQLSAMYDGKTTVTKGLANIFGSIALDSFVPIPVSKMPITEQPLEFLLDSIAPSIARPVLELALNKNGLGQVIHNEQTRRFGDAYTGGDSIPQIYKDAARGIANETTGAFDWNPNTLYFLSNTYMDGPGRVIETLYGINDLSQGRKNFNPKTDIPLMGSFFGSKVNIDAQQFSNVENKIKRIEGIMKQFATDPEQEVQYMIKYPLHAAVVDYYNKGLVPLNALRKEANEYRLNKYLSPKDRSDLLKLNTMQANLVKNQMIEVFKAYDITP